MFKLKLNEFFDYFRFQFSLLALAGLRFDFAKHQIKKAWQRVAYKLLFILFTINFGWNIISLVLSLFLLNQTIEERISFVTQLFSIIESSSKIYFLFKSSKIIVKILRT